jgi:hypothetical protein
MIWNVPFWHTTDPVPGPMLVLAKKRKKRCKETIESHASLEHSPRNDSLCQYETGECCKGDLPKYRAWPYEFWDDHMQLSCLTLVTRRPESPLSSQPLQLSS